jgi:enoyl-CoA hydratase
MTHVLELERDGVVLTATINRPDAYNALNSEVLRALDRMVDEAARDARVRAVVLTGAGQKAFSAGADLKEFDGIGVEDAQAKMRFGQQVMRSIEMAPVPVIAAVNGLALGGGFELVLSCTFSVMSSNASLGLPESSLGLIPGYGGTQRLPMRIGSPAAAHVMLTGTRLSAERAYQLGLCVLPPVAPDELAGTAAETAQAIAEKGPRATRAILTALGLASQGPVEAGLAMETGLASLALVGAESTEGVSAFLEKRPAKFADVEESR